MLLSCEGSDFTDKDHEHIVTGDVRIMRPYEKALQNNNISWNRKKARIMEGLNDCIETSCNRYDTGKYILKEWKVKLKDDSIKILFHDTSCKY